MRYENHLLSCALQGSHCINQLRADPSRVYYLPLCFSDDICDIYINKRIYCCFNMDGNTSKWNSFQTQAGRLTRNVYQQTADEAHSPQQLVDNVVKYKKAQPRHVI